MRARIFDKASQTFYQMCIRDRDMTRPVLGTVLNPVGNHGGISGYNV